MNQSEARRATSSSVPGSSNRCVAPGTIASSTSQAHASRGIPVHAEHLAVEAPDDQQARCPHEREGVAGEVGPAAARDDGAHGVGPLRRRDECGGGAGARSERAQRQTGGIGASGDRIARDQEPLGQQGDVEPQVPGPQVDRFLGGGQQIEEQRREPVDVEHVGHQRFLGLWRLLPLPWAKSTRPRASRGSRRSPSISPEPAIRSETAMRIAPSLAVNTSRSARNRARARRAPRGPAGRGRWGRPSVSRPPRHRRPVRPPR